ncbi:MAG TPA: metal-dependent hydrolase [Thermoanaerobaculia bacterium]|nr:metal-dependent hydrolase [Thermoanaerobaculia bacterium]
MFVGHFGLGLSGKAATPRVSLGTWFLSVQFLDLLWPLFLLLGWEHVRIRPGITRLTPLDFYDYPWTHSLAGALAWSLAFAGVHFALRRRAAVAALLGAGVLSHWVLDLLVHRPDLPLLPGRGPYVGMGLWNSPAIEIAAELILYALGAVLYLRSTRAKDGAGRFGIWALLLLLLVIWLSSACGPPPPSPTALAWMALGQWLFIFWAYRIDRHREPRGAPA